MASEPKQLGTCERVYGKEPHSKSISCVNWRPAVASDQPTAAPTTGCLIEIIEGAIILAKAHEIPASVTIERWESIVRMLRAEAAPKDFVSRTVDHILTEASTGGVSADCCPICKAITKASVAPAADLLRAKLEAALECEKLLDYHGNMAAGQIDNYIHSLNEKLAAAAPVERKP